MIKALYIHIPFCVQKCFYCDFLSFSHIGEDIKQKYIFALQKEKSLWEEKLDLTHLETIFLGGGTPTCLSGGSFSKLISFLKELAPFSQLEITSEANPGTLTEEKLDLLKKAGVNRLSIGVQSFNKNLLKNIGRIHSVEDIYNSFALAREAGFDNINLDLMYGLPGQNLKDWESSLKKVLELNPEHLSLYQLKIEEGTPLGNKLKTGKLGIFDDEIALQMYVLARKLLAEHGYIQYEISNFSKPGWQCQHNLSYWQNQPYLGLGLGAHSHLPPYRRANIGSLEDYINNLGRNILPPFVEEKIDEKIAMSETMFMGLRLIKGVDLEHFKNRFHKSVENVFAEAIEKCLKYELIEFADNHLKLTDKGLYLGNLVFAEFLL